MLRLVQSLQKATRMATLSQFSRSCHLGSHYCTPTDFHQGIYPPVPPFTLHQFSQPLSLKGLTISDGPKGINHSKVPLIPPGFGIGKEYESPGRSGVVDRVIEEDPLAAWRSSIGIEEGPAGGINNNVNIEKQAARLIVIRRSKMNKHKLKKLRKKMKFVWLKVVQRREMRREKAYLNSKMVLIEAARNFDAKEYVASVIRKAKEEPIPRRWTDPLMPDWYREQEMEKEVRGKRYQKLLDLHLNHKITVDNK